MATFVPDLGKPNELCVEMTKIFRNMRYLTESFNRYGSSSTSTDLMTFAAKRSTLAHRLIALKIRKSPPNMTILDYQLESVRLGSLIYLDIVFGVRQNFCSVLIQLKTQLMGVITESEKQGFGEVDLQLRRGPLTWALWMGGLMSLSIDEETWFARRIAMSIKAWHREEMGSWTAFEGYLRRVSWADSLRTPRCLSLWNRVRAMCDENTEPLPWPTFPMESCVAS